MATPDDEKQPLVPRFGSLVPPPTPAAEPETAVRWARPRVMVLGDQFFAFTHSGQHLVVNDTISNGLARRGYQATSMHIGRPYHVEASSSWHRLSDPKPVPALLEKDIVVLDLAADLQTMSVNREGSPSVRYYWGSCGSGYVDERISTLCNIDRPLMHLLEHGRVFIIFAAWVPFTPTMRGLITELPNGKYDFCRPSAWNALPVIGRMPCACSAEESGETMVLVEGAEKSPMGRVLGKHLSGAHFGLTMPEIVENWNKRRDNRVESEWNAGLSLVDAPDDWRPLVVNEYGVAVAAELELPNNGRLLVLPQLAGKEAFLADLFGDALPEVCPHLFPEQVKAAWRRDPAYELPAVLELRGQQDAARAEAERKLLELGTKIAAAREQDGWLHDLVTETGAPLVQAVIRALKELGCSNVTSCDPEWQAKKVLPREDVRFENDGWEFVVDIKGINGASPTDGDAMQAKKHANIRLRELVQEKQPEKRRSNVRSLMIINHQRGERPDQRKAEPFRQELIDEAAQEDCALMTGWDLYRLITSARRHRWPADQVRPLFHTNGRVGLVPRHYREWTIALKIFPKAKSFEITVPDSVKVGDRLAVLTDLGWHESAVASLQVDKKPVDTAAKGQKAGLKLADDLPIGDDQRLWFVTLPAPAQPPLPPVGPPPTAAPAQVPRSTPG